VHYGFLKAEGEEEYALSYHPDWPKLKKEIDNWIGKNADVPLFFLYWKDLLEKVEPILDDIAQILSRVPHVANTSDAKSQAKAILKELAQITWLDMMDRIDIQIVIELVQDLKKLVN